MYNWTTEYKNVVKCVALNYGEAGEIILEGKDLQLPKQKVMAKLCELFSATVNLFPG
jgi:hypothetical protein